MRVKLIPNIFFAGLILSTLAACNTTAPAQTEKEECYFDRVRTLFHTNDQHSIPTGKVPLIEPDHLLDAALAWINFIEFELIHEQSVFAEETAKIQLNLLDSTVRDGMPVYVLLSKSRLSDQRCLAPWSCTTRL